MKSRATGRVLFWIGLSVAVAFAAIIGQGLDRKLGTLTGQELDATIWALDKAIFLLSFFAIVWIWMKRYTGLDAREKAAGSYKLIG